MSESDWAGCVRIARAAPPSPEIASTEISCLIRLGQPDALERACDRFVARYPRHPFAGSCPGLVRAARTP
jgi:hypothetical protein